MSVGDHIRKFREAKDLTQKDLADKLFVTPQAVSRWENGDVEPSVDTLKQMALIFGVSIDDLVQDEPKAPVPEKVIEPVPAPVVTPVAEPVKEPRLLGNCVLCGKAIYDNDSYGYGHKTVTYTGRGHHHKESSFVLGTSSLGEGYVCQGCLDKMAEEKKIAEEAREYCLSKRRSSSWGWGIFAGIVGLAIAIIAAVACQKNGDLTSAIWLYCLSPVFAYALFSLIFVLVNDNTFVSDLFMELASFACVKMPGVIFSLDIDGIVFLIVAKIFLGLIALAIWVFAMGFAIAFSSLFSMFMFPVALKREPEEE